MTEQEQAPSPIPGRGWPDVSIQVLQMLGKLGPAAIIVGGLLFALYMFFTAISEAQLRADQQTQAKLEAAQNALVKTYSAIGDLSSQQIANVQKLLKLNEDVATSTETRRKQLDEIQDRADEQRKLAEAAKKQAEQARAEADKARAEADKSREEAEKAQADLDSLNKTTEQKKALAERELRKLEQNRAELRAELESVQKDIEKKSAVLEARAETIEELREQLETLAKQVAGRTTDAAGTQLAQTYLEQEAFRTPRNLLTSAAAQPGRKAFENLSALDGLREEHLRPLLEEGMGFAFWTRMYAKDEDEGGYFGSVEQDEDRYLYPIWIGTDQGRVFDVEYAKEVFAVELPSVDDWYVKGVATYFVEFEGTPEADVFELDARKASWRFETLVLAGEEVLQQEVEIELVYGEERGMRFLTIGELALNYPEQYAALTEDESVEHRLLLGQRMRDRAQDFDAAQLTGMDEVEFPQGLRQGFANFLNAVVRRDASAVTYLAETSYLDEQDLGRIAAEVLKDDFSIDAVSAMLSEQEELVGKGRREGSVWILASYFSPLTKGALHKLRFRFVQRESGWVLADFEPLRHEG